MKKHPTNSFMASFRVYLLCLIGMAFYATHAASEVCSDFEAPCAKGIRSYIQKCEREFGLPENVLLSLATVESRLNPWAVYGNKRSKFFETKKDAVAYVMQLKARGFKNINVGLLQINLQYHEDQFKSIADAFDPVQNIRYGGGYLKDLWRRFKYLHMAIRRYNSPTPKYNLRYLRLAMRACRKYNGQIRNLRYTPNYYKTTDGKSADLTKDRDAFTPPPPATTQTSEGEWSFFKVLSSVIGLNQGRDMDTSEES